MTFSVRHIVMSAEAKHGNGKKNTHTNLAKCNVWTRQRNSQFSIPSRIHTLELNIVRIEYICLGMHSFSILSCTWNYSWNPSLFLHTIITLSLSLAEESEQQPCHDVSTVMPMRMNLQGLNCIVCVYKLSTNSQKRAETTQVNIAKVV